MFHETLVHGHEYIVLSQSPISAWSILFGGKDVVSEARPTVHRGRVLIHASGVGLTLRESQAKRAELCFLSGLGPSALPTIFARCTILGSVELVDCVDDARSKWAVPGKCHWVLRDPRALPAPLADIDSERQFWRFTYATNAEKSIRPARAPTRSGIVPAVRLEEIEDPGVNSQLSRKRRG
jgi:hypothetical protein